MAINQSEQLTPRESVMMDYEREQAREAREHAIRIKQLEIEVLKMEAKWSSWLRIPLFIIMLPVRVIMAVGWCIAVSRKYDLGENFWNFMRK